MNRSNIYAGIWLIGLGILFLTDFFWPGILILIGVTTLVRALVPADASEHPARPVAEPLPAPQAEPIDPDVIPPALGEDYAPAPEAVVHNISHLPDNCPLCGGPVLDEPATLMWTDDEHVHCPYCRTMLPLPPLIHQQTEADTSD